MSSQEEGDYVDMSGLVFTYFPLHFKQKTLWYYCLMTVHVIHVIFFIYFYF